MSDEDTVSRIPRCDIETKYVSRTPLDGNIQKWSGLGGGGGA